ncbi:DHH family phosphoesterase [Butyrivibrio sp. AE2032]|uniref:DHH family phosphoesterase n=1 Tax=Butyrivibrio sp. AE2032 TaxID=1458463 RepID=UPI0005511673|nr:DHH family phosphoesterase [Butyrivibrio sp. AE2032]
MELKNLLKFDNIVIQCHDNPDADALASGYALKWYFEQNKKSVKFIYRGRNEIRKSNLIIMVRELEIPVSYEPFFAEEPDLLITVDCQYGEKNVTKTEAKRVAIIDHHRQVVDSVRSLTHISSDIGSCATVVWDMIKNEGMDPNDNRLVATALYYGLFSDTNKLSEVSHPLDRDMMDSLIYNKSVITSMVNSNISLDELMITGKAILNYEYHDSNKYLVIEAEACDPCILGVISDFALETENVDVCLAFYVTNYEVKFSVRSCSREVYANELAAFLADGIGGGGGHMLKAGGTIRAELLDRPAKEVLEERMVQYYDSYAVIYAKNTTLDTSRMKRYKKVQQSLGAVKLTDVFPAGTPINIRTLEGDVDTVVEKDDYLMIGIEGEIYPIKEQKLMNSYQFTNFRYTRDFEYEPRIRNTSTGEIKKVLPFAQTVRSTGSTIIFAKPLEQPVKLFTAWSDDKYYSGRVGDYIAVRADDEHDIYIINIDIFDRTYQAL